MKQRRRIDLYRAANKKPLAKAFADPDAIFRGAPFWSWNNRLDIPQLLRQIEIFKIMGMGGFHMHSRTGLATPYLGDRFMVAVRACVEKAAEIGMYAFLYDEDRFPSGYGGGSVTSNPDFRSRHLLFTPKPYGTGVAKMSVHEYAGQANRTENGRLLARYAIRINADGFLGVWGRLQEGEPCPPDAVEWFAYLETATPTEWFNGQTYVDTLNPRAIKQFVAFTHERYRETVGEFFGNVVPAIFTDEPQFSHKTNFSTPEQQEDLVIPWTDDFVETHTCAYGVDPLDTLAEVFWEKMDAAPSLARYRYHDHVAECFASAFADTIGNWCSLYGLALTGHMMKEPTLLSQTLALGETMRSYRAFHIPGVDVLCDGREYTTLKQAQSAVRQYGRSGMMSELYGVTNWDFDFRGHKSQGDWQAALGVTLRVHHLAWVSMEGEAKRDYPASISYQSPWWQKYSLVEDHFARLGAVLTRGSPRVRIGVIHPVESYWLNFGPDSQTRLQREGQDEEFRLITEWLLTGQFDFDFICESLLPEQTSLEQITSPCFPVGFMAYDAVVVPPLRTMRSSTLERLEVFVSAGGKLVFVGPAPELVDALPSVGPENLARRSERIVFTRTALMQSMASLRDLEITTTEGKRHDGILYQWRYEGVKQYIFVCDSRRDSEPTRHTMNGNDGALSCRIRLLGYWEVSLMDTATGKIHAHPVRHFQGWTELYRTFHCHGHVLLRLSPTSRLSESSLTVVPSAGVSVATLDPILSGPHSVTLFEPNVLLLDAAEWRWNDGLWQPREEILRLDNRIRVLAGLKPRDGQGAQPWTKQDSPERSPGVVQLRFKFKSDIDLTGVQLALEVMPGLVIRMDGNEVSCKPTGWWVDEAIQRISLPFLPAGTHELILIVPYPAEIGLEWVYLLGDFGVSMAGSEARIIKPVRKLAWGDITHQGLPFYTGNLTYHVVFDNPQLRKLALHAPHFHGALIGLQCNGLSCKDIAFAPYISELGWIEAGSVKLDLTLYGNRYNAFGPLHCAARPRWVGPQSWRTTDEHWCEEYHLRPLGLLFTPRLVTGGVT